jgi:integrase
MGLGSIQNVSLKEARQSADHWRSVVRAGKNPIKERRHQQREAIRNLHCLNEIAHDAFDSRKAELKDDGKAGRWFTPLQLHVLPTLGKVPVAEIDQIDIRDVLRPIWHTKADTARKAMNRLSICLKHAAALGLNVDLQAVDKAKALLGKQNHTVQHVPALPWKEVPSFYASLADGSITHLALRMLILTAVRSRPLRHMRFDQIEQAVWTIPAELMKGRRGATADFRVPLSPQVLAIIEQTKPFERNGYLFPSMRKGVISDATMARFMERLQMRARPHGFRSSFRDWTAEAADARHEVAEACLSHVNGTQVERAYRRTDYLDQRRVLMDAWGTFVSTPHIDVNETYNDF